MKLEDFKNKHTGKRVFILGNGPSLKNTPLEKLNNEFTIGMNKINLIFSSTDWRPSYFVYVRGTYKEEMHQERLESYMKSVNLGIPSFISKENKKYFPEKRNIMYIDKEMLDDWHKYDSANEILKSGWSRDITNKVYGFGSTMYVAAQIASYMGFDEIYFVGCDGYNENPPSKGFMFPEWVFSSGNNPKEYVDKNKIEFLFDNGKPFRSLINGISFKLSKSRFKNIFVFDSGKDSNHFDEDYTKDELRTIQKTQAMRRNQRLIKMHDAIEMMGNELGFKTYNATVEKNIDIHEPVEFNDVV